MKKPVSITGEINNWLDMEEFFHLTFDNVLKTPSNENGLFFVESSSVTIKQREKLASIVFESLGSPYFQTLPTPFLILVAHNLTTGLVLDCGDGQFNSCSIHESAIIPKSFNQLEIGGNDLTKLLVKLINSQYYNLLSTRSYDEQVIKMKETLIYAAAASSHLTTPSIATDTGEYELPDGFVLSLDEPISECLYTSVEPIFQPSLLGLNERSGIQNMIYNSIESVKDSMIKTKVSENVVLTGGSSMIKGLTRRLSNELVELIPSLKIHDVIEDNKYAAWIGASMMASQSTFLTSCHSKIDYDENGYLCKY